MSRLIIAGMAAGLVVMIPMLFLFRQMGTAGADSGQGQNAISAPGFGGLGLAPGRSPMAVANDAVRKANAMRLQVAVSQFYAANERYPKSIAEIPPQMLGFKADPNIYQYSVIQKPYGFRIEVVMQGGNISGSHIVTEGDVTKYVYEGQ